jgi:NTP pyrophosphatase (non-canonical NTP hydrolase)
MLDENTTVSELRGKVDKFIQEREWTRYQKPKDLAISIVLESSELLEHFQWLKDEEIEAMIGDSRKLQDIESELADVLIYCLGLANVLRTDLSNIVLRKMEENENRYPIDKIKGVYRKYSQIDSEIGHDAR